MTDSNVRAQRTGIIHKRLAALQRNASLTKREYLFEKLVTPLPDLLWLKVKRPILDDCRVILESYGHEGVVDPFEKVYKVNLNMPLVCLFRVSDPNFTT